MKRLHFTDRQSWLDGRKPLMTASDVAASVGLIDQWKTSDDLYNEKVGLVKPRDISGNDNVIFGSLAEEHIRQIFSLEFKNRYRVEHYPFDILVSDEHPFLGATLDGELEYIGEDREVMSVTGMKATMRHDARGVYEVKTSTVRSKRDLEFWTSRIPDHYFAQHCIQLYVTGYEFGIHDDRIALMNYERNEDGELVETEWPTIYTFRHLYIASDPIITSSTEYLVEKACEFQWCVENRQRPARVIRRI
jgi:putative phage-type endonuclease